MRFETLMGSAFKRENFCEILSHSVRYGINLPPDLNRLHAGEFRDREYEV